MAGPNQLVGVGDGHSLRGQVAVVTGGNQGIGAAIAGAFAEAGASIVIAARTESSLAEMAQRLIASGADCLPVRCDVTDEQSVAALGDSALKRFSKVDVVVANAGVAGPSALMHTISYEQWRECMAIDLDGVFLTFRRFIPHMLERGSGCLIAISSMTGKRPLYGRTPYASAKMGVIGLVRTLAHELGPSGIRVNTICPGAVDGPRIEAVIERQAAIQGLSIEEARSQLIDSAALKRLVTPQEVAAACVFIASPASASITGEDLNVTAGVVMY